MGNKYTVRFQDRIYENKVRDRIEREREREILRACIFRLNELLRLCAVDKTYQQKTTDLQATLRSSVSIDPFRCETEIHIFQLNKLDRYEKAVANLQKALSENTNLPEQSDSMVSLIYICL